MEARDGSAGFDYAGRFTQVGPLRRIGMVLDDGRPVMVEFVPHERSVTVREIFEAEDDNSPELQSQGWQAILDNFAGHAERLATGPSA